ncbi:hypothetical protein [Nocardia sp. SYP-A9097]|uniref:hypothetical protein n=1 Tax=Nocardia sp. SYP-A9097 TaxID=2663237 RepID=UPI00129BFC87|nr:hypothetical protein [Nocardia sp. SYP-A9097]
MQLQRPENGIVFTNLAITGATTTQTPKSSGALRFQRPDWMLCQLGANDGQRLGTDGTAAGIGWQTKDHAETAAAPRARAEPVIDVLTPPLTDEQVAGVVLSN